MCMFHIVCGFRSPCVGHATRLPQSFIPGVSDMRKSNTLIGLCALIAILALCLTVVLFRNTDASAIIKKDNQC